jgi:hypothetical protein
MSAAAELVLASYSPEETFGIAMELGALLRGGETLALQGELGSGKTLFTKGLCAGLGVADPRGVASPTYVLEHVYEGSFPIHHYDVYRLASSDEFLALGFEEHLGGFRYHRDRVGGPCGQCPPSGSARGPSRASRGRCKRRGNAVDRGAGASRFSDHHIFRSDDNLAGPARSPLPDAFGSAFLKFPARSER